jgi:Cellulose synthase subunit D
MAHTQAILAYYGDQQVSPQWRDLLRAMAEEFDGQLAVPELRALMSRIGERFAAAQPLGACATLDEVEAALNALWRAIDWGWIELVDLSEHLAVRHYCAPIAAAFGPTAAVWASAFLEGAYQTWFTALGAGEQLAVRQLEAAGQDADSVAMQVYEFRLAR